MAQPPQQEANAPPNNMNARQTGLYANSLSIQACVADDPAIMERAISIAPKAGSHITPEKIATDGLKRAARRNALRVLRYLLDLGQVDVHNLCADNLLKIDTCEPPSLALLELVVAYGWEVNPKPGEYPLVPLVVEDINLVRWCLDHGARVDVPTEDPPVTNADGTTSYKSRPRPTLLGAAAAKGTIDVFELLRSRGAPLDRRTLHVAVENGRIDMIRHLLEVVGLDVNADGRSPFSLYHSCSTAICITAFRRGSTWGFSRITSYLLDRGADPDLSFGEGKELFMSAVECAEWSRNTEFLRVLAEWRARKESGAEETLAQHSSPFMDV